MQRRRPDLRIIIASATIQADDFKAFFDTSHVTLKKPSAATAAEGGAEVGEYSMGKQSAAGAGVGVGGHSMDKQSAAGAATAGEDGPLREPGVISVEGRAHSVLTLTPRPQTLDS